MSEEFSSLKIGVIENKGPNKLDDHFKEAFKSYKNVDFAVAFVNSNGLRLIDNDIRSFLEKPSTKMRILTRISREAFNEPSALKWLMDMSKEYPNLEVKLSTLNDKFHSKMYIFKNGSSSNIFIGSSNLTEKALGMEGEVNLSLSIKTENEVFKHLTETFEESWEKQSTDLTDETLNRYTAYYEHFGIKKLDKKAKMLWQKVSANLKKKEKSTNRENIAQKVWLDFTDGQISKRTEIALEQYCSWKNYQCYSCGLKTYKKIKRNDLLLMADFCDGWISLNVVKSRTQLPHNMGDGKYFLAYSKKKNSRKKKINKNSLYLLKSNDIIDKPTKTKLKPSSAKDISRLVQELTSIF